MLTTKAECVSDGCVETFGMSVRVLLAQVIDPYPFHSSSNCLDPHDCVEDTLAAIKAIATSPNKQ